MKIKNRVFLTTLLLGYFTFSSCSEKKPNANEKRENPFGTASGIGTGVLQRYLAGNLVQVKIRIFNFNQGQIV